MIFKKEKLLIFLIPLFLSLPFINRAYFVDDNYFVEIAEWLVKNPTLPYHFRADDAGIQNRGWEEDGFVRMVNPLLHHYYLAALIKLGGTREWFLRLGVVLISCFMALFILGLARRWTYNPLLSTFLVCVTPAFWLSSHSLLIDSTMGMFFMGALYFFVVATEQDKFHWLVLSGIFMGLAILSKYTALLIIPLTGLWWVIRWKKINRKWMYGVPWVMAGGFLLAYSVWTSHLYGAPHIIAASQRMVQAGGWPKYLVFFIFLSGVSLLPALIWSTLNRKIILFNGIFVVLLAKFFASDVGGYSIPQAFLMSFFFFTSLVFISNILTRYKTWIFPKDHFLMGWLLGFCVMMFVVMNWVAGRYYIIVIPALVFLSVRIIEMNWPQKAQQYLKIIAGVLFLFSGALVYADYQQAAPSRDLVQQLRNKGYQGGDRHFYLGDSFTMSYFRDEGWIPAFPETKFKVGDLILSKSVTMPLNWFGRRPVKLNIVDEFNYPTSFPLKVMDMKGSAGFYASIWGSLPFTFSTGPWERFRIYRVIQTYENN